MADTSPQSRAAIRKALQELIQAGFYRVEKIRMPDGRIRSEAHVYDTPQLPGLEEAKELIGVAVPQVEPSVPRPASGAAGSGDAGVLGVKNREKEPSLPASADDKGLAAAPTVRQPRPTGGWAKPSIDDLDEPRKTAALLLHRVLKDQPRLPLGEAELVKLAPLVAQWTAAGCGPAALGAALLSGLPETIHSPEAVIRSRLERKLPPVPGPKQPAPASAGHECDECKVPMPRLGLCGPCTGKSVHVVAVGLGERHTVVGAAQAREAIRRSKQIAGAHR